MKSIFTLLFISAFSFIHAQSLTLNMYEATIAVDEYLDYGVVLLTNNGTAPIEIGVTLEQLCYADEDDAKMQICLGETCFFQVNTTSTFGTTGGASLVVNPGETSDGFKFTSFPGVADLGSEWNVVFFDRNNPTDLTSLNIKVGDQCSAVSTNEITAEVKAAFPNPATNNISIAYMQNQNKGSLMVYNTVGQLQETVSLNQGDGSVELAVSNYQHGVYFYFIEAEEGRSKVLSFLVK